MALKIPARVKSIMVNPKLTKDEKWQRLKDLRINKRHPMPSGGAYVDVLVFPTFVVKRWRPFISIEWKPSGFNADVEFVRKMRRSPNTRPFFAQTIRIGPFLVQERVKMDPDLSYDLIEAIEVFGESLGMGDIHEENVGWRQTKQGPMPVFFDFNLRSQRPKRIQRGSYVKKWKKLYKKELQYLHG